MSRRTIETDKIKVRIRIRVRMFNSVVFIKNNTWISKHAFFKIICILSKNSKEFFQPKYGSEIWEICSFTEEKCVIIEFCHIPCMTLRAQSNTYKWNILMAILFGWRNNSVCFFEIRLCWENVELFTASIIPLGYFRIFLINVNFFSINNLFVFVEKRIS